MSESGYYARFFEIVVNAVEEQRLRDRGNALVKHIPFPGESLAVHPNGKSAHINRRDRCRPLLRDVRECETPLSELMESSLELYLGFGTVLIVVASDGFLGKAGATNLKVVFFQIRLCSVCHRGSGLSGDRVLVPVCDKKSLETRDLSGDVDRGVD